jgi:hypothetical protein
MALSAVIHAGTIATGLTKASFAVPLLLATKGADTLTLFALSDQTVTGFIRRWGASRKVQVAWLSMA